MRVWFLETKMNSVCTITKCAPKHKTRRARGRALKSSAMAENHAEDDDDEGFGDFKFASFSNYTVHSNPNNGRGFSSNDDDDDDWGDFIKPSIQINNGFELPGGAHHIQSPPDTSLASGAFDPFGFSTDQDKSLQNQAESAPPSRVDSGKTEWVKVQGALPLSIFGDVEEESGAVDPSFGEATDFFSPKRSDSEKKGSVLNLGVGINDLIANLYKQSEQSKVENGSKPDSNGATLNSYRSNSDFNGLERSKNLSTLDTNEVDLKSHGLNLNRNGFNSSINGVNLDLNDLNSRGNVFNLEANVANSNSHASDLNWNGLTLDTGGLNSDLINGNGDFDDDDGWEFKGVESGVQAGDAKSKNGDSRTENGPTANFNGSNFSWNMLSSDITGLTSNFNGVNSDTNPLNLYLDGENEDFGDDDGWEFKGAESETQSGDCNTKVDGKGPENPRESFVSSNGISHKFSEWGVGFDFNKSSVTQDAICSDSHSNKRNDVENGLNSSPVNWNVDSDENLWAFEDLFSETGSKYKEEPKVANISPVGVEAFAFDGEIQKNEVSSKNHKEALPLSIFSDGELEPDDSLIYEDVSTHKPVLYPRDSIKGPGSEMPISDLISSLYGQAEQKTNVNHTQNPSEYGLASTPTVMDSDLVNGDDDFEDDSWEFKGSFSGARAEDQTPVIGLGDSHPKHSTETKLNDYVDLYFKLTDELCFVVICHLDNLKKAQSFTGLSSEDAEVKALDKEIQDLFNELLQDNMISKEVNSENHPPRNCCLNGFVEVLQEPKFRVLESEYHLSNRLLLAEKDLRSAIELLKHAASTQKILKLGSAEDQSNYVSTWSKMVSVCAQELKHGAFIWKQSLEKNVNGQILSKPQGKQYILALGEIYRVFEILGSSAKLYKPWILLSAADPQGMFVLLSECSSLWSSSGLEEAIRSISDPSGFGYSGTHKALLESIKYIRDLDADALFNLVFSGQEPICRLSVLTVEAVPGMKMVVWNGEHYFLTLVNLWANLISSDPPTLPAIHVG